MSRYVTYTLAALGCGGSAYAAAVYLHYAEVDAEVKRQEAKLSSAEKQIRQCEKLAAEHSSELEQLQRSAQSDREVVVKLEDSLRVKQEELAAVQQKLKEAAAKLSEKQDKINKTHALVNDLKAKLLQHNTSLPAMSQAIEEARQARRREAELFNPLNHPKVKQLFGKAT